MKMNILPKPQKALSLPGRTKITQNSHVSGDFESGAIAAAKFISELGIKGDGCEIRVLYNPSIEEEGYNLAVNDEVVIEASHERGVFYALQSLRQLIDLNGFSENIKVEDYPAFSWRGFMLDESRHFFGSEVVKQILDHMAYHKMNVFHWHLTDSLGWRLEIKKHPGLTSHSSIRKNTQLNDAGDMTGKEYGRGLFYTQEQIKEIIEYARERFITVVPEIDMPGHMVCALSLYPNLSCKGEPLEVTSCWEVDRAVGCVGNDELLIFAKEVLGEVADLFDSPYVHIGGDEVEKKFWKACPKCQKKIKKLNLKDENELHGYFNNQIIEFLRTKGKHLIGWNEILDATTLDSETIVEWWNTEREKPLKWLSKGGKIILCSWSHVYLDHPYAQKPLEKIYGYGCSALDIDESLRKNVLGLEAPLWTEKVFNKDKLDFNLYPRLQALAEACWTQEHNKNYRDFERRLQKYLMEMKDEDINFCPPEKYNPVGLKGLRQRRFVKRNDKFDPCCEMKF